MLIVQKYGGSSLADSQRIHAAARRIAQCAVTGAQMVVVVSAQADTTDHLIENARSINPKGSAREMDAYLATGEQQCAALMAMALEELGFPAVSLNSWQVGMLTDGNHGNARIRRLTGSRLQKELNAGKIVIVAGFQGVDSQGDITTLGRGGSDTTAVALAAFLQADVCQIYTDVDGVYDKDPRKFPQAVRYDRLDYETMLHMAENGAQVLHAPCVALAQQYGVRLRVLSSFREGPGTVVD